MKTPFTTEQFFQVFEKYNNTVFPLQLLFLLLGIISLFLLHSQKEWKDRFISFFLGFLWLWMGIVYHIGFFTEINKAAYVFGAFFILQGFFFLLITWKTEGLRYELTKGSKAVTAEFFIVFGLIIYPVIAYFLHDSWRLTISPGLPCPTTIMTFGFLMLVSSRLPKYLLIIPSLWALVGLSAVFNFGVYQDLMLIVAAITANVFIVIKMRTKKN